MDTAGDCFQKNNKKELVSKLEQVGYDLCQY